MQPGKRQTDQAFLIPSGHDDCVLSVQVLQEFYVQATRPTRADPIEHRQAVALIESWLRFFVQELTVPILEAARAAGCRDVLSEDLQDGRDYGGVRVANPFRGM